MATEVLLERPRKTKKTRPKTQTEEEVPLDPSSSKDLTRNKFNEILQQAYLQSTQNDTKTGKKKKKKADQDMLESLRKGEGLRKDQDANTLLANTYDPDDVKGTKSNKQRARANKSAKGSENLAFEVNEDESPKRSSKGGRKLPKTSPDIKQLDKDLSISELTKSATKTEKGETESQAAPPSEKKKKKKKVVKSPTSDSEQVLSEDQETGDLQANATSDDPLSKDEEAGTDTKKKKKRRKKKAAEAGEDVPETETPEDAASPEPPPKVAIQDEGRVAGLTIHRTDKLKTDFFISHPLVRVIVVDALTGQYLKKQNKGRAVSSFYERENENVDMVLPIMTQPYDFKLHKSTLPVWEEMLIFNENFNYLTQEDPKVMVFFEVLDFVSMNTARQKYNNAKQEGGWHRIAWGFLKVVGANGKANTEKKVRLQLYQPLSRFRTRGSELEIFQWWKSGQRLAYPSTLYVSLRSIVPPERVEPAARSMFATQEERGRITFDELQKTMEGGVTQRDGSRKGPSLWSRLPGQLCKIPNSPNLSLPAGRNGCFITKFSHDGKSLACGCADKEGHPILIYEIPSGRLKGQLLGHYSIIYELCWGRSDKHLLSASADGTARVWDVVKLSTSPSKTLPHPSFVYTAKFHPRVSRVVVTGGYDRMIRIWSVDGDNSHGHLLQELGGHNSYVNTLCFDEDGSRMYSGDSLGQICLWNVYATEKPSSRGVLREWSLHKDINEPEIKGIAINQLMVHPNGRRLMVHSRDNTIRMLDLRMDAVCQRYIGALNFREHLHSTISPCGSFVFAGSEDSCVYVWNAESGDQVAMYSELCYKAPVSSVDFHPHDNLVAFSSFGDSQPVLLYKYDHKAAQREVGIDPVDTLDTAVFKKTGRPQSPEIRSGLVDKSEDEGFETSRSRVLSLHGDHQTQETARMERIRKKLESVTAFQGSVTSDRLSPPPLPGIPTSLLATETWGSTFDYSPTPRLLSPEPGTFSPHASRTLGTSQQQHQFMAQTEYMRSSESGWRPAFSSVGQRSPSRGMMPPGRSPQMNLAMTDPGKIQFSFQALPSQAKKPKELQPYSGLTRPFQMPQPAQPVPSREDRAKRKKMLEVVALYDYQAQRSDELSLNRGDVIMVLYHDNANWWMGESTTGEQGFFPANYVATQDSVLESQDEKDGRHQKENGRAEDEDEETEVHVPINPASRDEEGVTNHSVTAVVTKSGDLKFVSGTEDSDVETPSRRTKKKTRRSHGTKLSLENEETTPTKATRKKRAAKSLSESTA